MNMYKPEENHVFFHLRFLGIVVLSLGVLFFDVRTNFLDNFRYYLETSLYPVLAFADSPHVLSRLVTNQFKSHSDLIEENERLAAENYMQRADIARLQSLEIENEAMRKLLNSPQRESAQRIFAEVINIDSNPYLKRVVVNRGTQSNVYEGMPVISDIGLVGQVIEVNYSFSRVLLLTDPNCAVPVVDSRSGVRAITNGSGADDEILINNVQRSSDVRIGDMLITSGLGGHYPEGYPVAVITEIGYSDSQPFALIKAKPVVDFDRMRYVLMYYYMAADKVNEPDIPAKQPSDAKLALRQERIRQLIDSLSTPQSRD